MKQLLSLDGGGTWALLQAQTLGEIYGANTPGHAILAQFDLVAANSGGSIVLGGLLANRTPAEIEALFTDADDRTQIFKRTFWSNVPFAGRIAARYDTRAKLAGLDRIFGRYRPAPAGLPCNHWTLENLADQLRAASPALFPAGKPPPHVLVAGFNLDQRRANFFRSPPGRRDDPTDQLRVIEALHFSSSAPIRFFDEPATADLSHATGDTPFWDGAMGGHNNPVHVAVLEALSLGWDLTDAAVLSLGTGSVQLPLAGAAPAGTAADFVARRVDPGSLRSAVQLAATTIVEDPPDAATFAVHLLLEKLGCPPALGRRCVRLSPLVRPRLPPGAPAGASLGPPRFGPAGPVTAADLKLFRQLRDLEMDATEDNDVRAIAALGRAWLRDEITNQTLSGRTDVPPGAGIDWRRTTNAWRAWQRIAAAPPGGWPPVPATAPSTDPF